MSNDNTNTQQCDSFDRLTIDAMETLFHYKPRRFQQEVIPHILRMKNRSFPTSLPTPPPNYPPSTTTSPINSHINCPPNCHDASSTNTSTPQPVLIVQGTGGGKSSIYQTIGLECFKSLYEI